MRVIIRGGIAEVAKTGQTVEEQIAQLKQELAEERAKTARVEAELAGMGGKLSGGGDGYGAVWAECDGESDGREDSRLAERESAARRR